DISEKYLIEGYLDTMKTYGNLQGKNYYIYGSEDIIKKMFNSLNLEKQKEALSILWIDNKNNINSENLFSELVLPVFKSTLSSDSSNITEGISIKMLEKLAEKTDIDPLSVYTQSEILERIIFKNEYERMNTPIIEFFKNLRYRKIITFSKYLIDNSSNDCRKPIGYDDFIIQFDTLMEK
ncbi:MAG: hypothetical protein KAH95_07005, partial [Spirochaetales bacterium]|nr:hypothetical protein [Spirochaetales bacterium]